MGTVTVQQHFKCNQSRAPWGAARTSSGVAGVLQDVLEVCKRIRTTAVRICREGKMFSLKNLAEELASPQRAG